MAIEFAPAKVDIEHIADGGLILRSPMQLAPYANDVCSYLGDWAEAAATRTFLAERAATGEWRQLTYGDALVSVRSVAQALLDDGVNADRPLMILSGNSIENGLLQLAAMYIGAPVTPVSPPYSLMSSDFGKLRYIFELVQPKVVYASDSGLYKEALAALDLRDVAVVTDDNGSHDFDARSIDEVLATTPTQAVDAANSLVGADTIAKILFTSGSTGMPKGVINTQRMLCSNQQGMAQIWPFIARRPPVIVDWLPWHHTFGGNHNFNMILRNGGTLYIDNGKPAPGLFEDSVKNLREVAPTVYFNVPRGFQMLAPILEQDPAFRDHFFSNLDTIFYAAAALPQDVWERIESLSIAAIGRKIAMTSAWGLTESAPGATYIHFPSTRAGVIGLPLPGTELKMVPSEGKMELRLRGPNITPGYYKRDDLTAAAFDEEGFLKTGDAGKFADPDEPAEGVVFDGRVAEDFKLLTGSWVSTGEVRVAAISTCADIIQDAVVAGHDRDEIGLLIVPNVAGIADIAGLDSRSPLHELLNNATVRRTLRTRLAAYNARNPASTSRIARVMFLVDPLSIDAGEIADKGYINQRAVLERRHKLVDRLFSDDADVITVSSGAD